MIEIVVQVVIACVGIGTFVGTTRNALHSIEKRLDNLERMGYAYMERLATVETKLDGK